MSNRMMILLANVGRISLVFSQTAPFPASTSLGQCGPTCQTYVPRRGPWGCGRVREPPRLVPRGANLVTSRGDYRGKRERGQGVRVRGPGTPATDAESSFPPLNTQDSTPN